MPSITWLLDSTSLSLLFFGRNMTGGGQTGDTRAPGQPGIHSFRAKAVKAAVIKAPGVSH